MPIIILGSEDLRELHETHNRSQPYTVRATDGSVVEIRPWDPSADDLSVEGRAGVTFTREQLEGWAGRPLSDDDMVRLEAAILNSSIPDAVWGIAAALLDTDTQEGSEA